MTTVLIVIIPMSVFPAIVVIMGEILERGVEQLFYFLDVTITRGIILREIPPTHKKDAVPAIHVIPENEDIEAPRYGIQEVTWTTQ